MKRLEKLIRDMRKQMLPYHHDHDIEQGTERWEVEKGEYLESWVALHLKMCMDKNRCKKRGRCAFYEYADLAKRNFEICLEVVLRLENGEIHCTLEED